MQSTITAAPLMPFAPTVLAERAGDYLVNPKGLASPYMMLAMPTRPEARRSITKRGPPLTQFSTRCESTDSSKSKKSSRLKNFAECMPAD